MERYTKVSVLAGEPSGMKQWWCIARLTFGPTLLALSSTRLGLLVVTQISAFPEVGS